MDTYQIDTTGVPTFCVGRAGMIRTLLRRYSTGNKPSADFRAILKLSFSSQPFPDLSADCDEKALLKKQQWEESVFQREGKRPDDDVFAFVVKQAATLAAMHMTVPRE